MIKVLFEDNHVLALSKPPGLLTQPSGIEDDNLQEQAKDWLKKKYDKPGKVYLEPIHRLDRAAGGIVVFAKTSKALSRLTAEIRNKTVKKMYLALVSDAPNPSSGSLEHYLVHDDFRAKVVHKNNAEGKHAHLHYKMLREIRRGVLLEIELITGRYHQIRVQLATIGFPIIGDKKYGSNRSWQMPGIALHHFHCEIPHPTTKQLLIFEDIPAWSN